MNTIKNKLHIGGRKTSANSFHSEPARSAEPSFPVADSNLVNPPAAVSVQPVTEPVLPSPDRKSNDNESFHDRDATLQHEMIRSADDVQSAPPTNQNHITTITAPSRYETLTKPTVVHEHIHPVQKEEVQPIIYREREQLEIRQITQPMKEVEIAPVTYEKRTRDAEIREDIVERGPPVQENLVLPSTRVAGVERTMEVLPTIVREKVQKTVVEEVTQVLHKDTLAPVIIEETRPIYEKDLQAPKFYQSSLPVRELGTIYGSNMLPMEQMRGFYYADLNSKPMWEKEVTVFHQGGLFEREVIGHRTNNFSTLAGYELGRSVNYSEVHLQPQMQSRQVFHGQQQSGFIANQGIPFSVTSQNGTFTKNSVATQGNLMVPIIATR